VLYLLDTAYVFLLLTLLVGYRTRLVSWALPITHLCLNHLRYSFGKIDHDILLVLLPPVMSFSAWGSCYSVDSRRLTASSAPPRARSISEHWPIAFMALLLSLGFLTAGVPKAMTWVDFDLSTSGTEAWVERGFYISGRSELLLPYLIHLECPLIWELMDYSVVVFELSFLLLLWHPRWWQRVVAVACLFHAANAFTLNISFGLMVGLYALFADWNTVARHVAARAKLECRFRAIGSVPTLLVGSAIGLPFYWFLRSGAEARDYVTPLQLVGWHDGRANLLVAASEFVILSYVLFRTARAKDDRLVSR
jgi:hypothetical protein